MPDKSRKLTPFSLLDVYRCRCGCRTPNDILDRLWNLDCWLWEAKVLVEDSLGIFVDMYVTSGYRCPKHNRKVGGARKSTHMRGLACDFQMFHDGKRVSPKRIYKILDPYQRNEVLPKGGLHAYRSFTHMDVRGRIARW